MSSAADVPGRADPARKKSPPSYEDGDFSVALLRLDLNQ